MIKIVAIVVVLFVVMVAAVLAYAATKPDTFRVQRATSIKAPPETIFALINDFRSWGAWSPYEKKDPAMKRTYSGPASGKGAVYAFEGDGRVGTGRLAITDASPPSKVLLTLDMFRPIEGHNLIEFTLEPQGDATSVTWAMQGRAPYIGKIVQVFFSMDSMVGTDFETGLANLKAVAEQ